MTTAKGTVTSCGPGQDYSLDYTCTGPSCTYLDGFPSMTCTTAGDVLSCTNGVVCPGQTNYTSQFTFTQADGPVSQTQLITLRDFCEDITLVSDGSTGGTNASFVSTGDCGPGGSNSSSSSSTTYPTYPTYPTGSGSTYSANPPPYTTYGGSIPYPSGTEYPTENPTGYPTKYPTGYPSSQYPTGNSTECSTGYPTEHPSEYPTGYPSSEYPSGHPTGYPSEYPTGYPSSGFPTGYPSSYPTGNPSEYPTEHPAGYSSGQTTEYPSGQPTEYPTAGSGEPAPASGNAQPSAPYASSIPGAPVSEPAYTAPSAAEQPGNNGPPAATEPSAGSGTAPPIQHSNNAGSFRQRSAPAIWLAILVFLGFLLPAVNATTFDSFAPAPRNSRLNSIQTNQTNHELFKRALGRGWEQFASDFAEYLAGKIGNPEFGDNLVDELASAVCDHGAGVIINKAIGADLVEECVAAIYTANAVVAPELEFLSVLGAGILCNLIVSDALPQIGELTDAICHHEKPCSEDLLTDPNNCGSCGNVVCFPFPFSLFPPPYPTQQHRTNHSSVLPESVQMVRAQATPAPVKLAQLSVHAGQGDRACARARQKRQDIAWTAARRAAGWLAVATAWIARLARSAPLAPAVAITSVWVRHSAAVEAGRERETSRQADLDC
jgi:hypothetical protein